MPFEYKQSNYTNGIDKDLCQQIILHQRTKRGLNPTDKWQIHFYPIDENSHLSDIPERFKAIEMISCNATSITWVDEKTKLHTTLYSNIIKISTYDSSKEGGKRKYKKSKKQTKSKKSNKSNKSNKSKKNKNQRK